MSIQLDNSSQWIQDPTGNWVQNPNYGGAGAVGSESRYFVNAAGQWQENPYYTPAPTPSQFTPPAGATSPLAMMAPRGPGPGLMLPPTISAAGPGLPGAIGTGIGVVGGLLDIWDRLRGKSTGPGNPPPPPGSLPQIPGQMPIGTAGIGMIPKVGGAIAKTPTGKKIVSVVGGVVGYYVLDKALGWIFKPGKPPSRKMNVMNAKALARADRRVTGFACKARGVMKQLGYQVSTTRKPKGSCRPGGKKKGRC